MAGGLLWPEPVLAQSDGAATDVDRLREQPPLPETADEVCTAARSLGAPDSSVYLGERATVSQLKALSLSGALARARFLHFAAHGLLAKETALFSPGRAGAALLLTPPARDQASPEDDGLLRASDAARLRLNADLVVLSGSNTAAGVEGGEPLSGLAAAFFQAGARSLLVSHWDVDSEALRRSLAAQIAKGGDNAHSAVWAPFVLVGEGGGESAGGNPSR
jgi:CHAT domain-containing protein